MFQYAKKNENGNYPWKKVQTTELENIKEQLYYLSDIL